MIDPRGRVRTVKIANLNESQMEYIGEQDAAASVVQVSFIEV
jgi:hypothetical protein